MINNLPNGWKVKELGNCVDILDNQRIPLNNQDREQRIKGKNISELYPYYGATQQVGYIDDFIFNEELVLLGEDGVMFYDRDKQKAYLINGKSWVNNHAHVLRAKKDITINKYILNYLNTFHYKGFVSGATRLKLNQSRMAKIPIPIPPLQQQEKIVKVLDLTSNLIEKQKELLEKYDLFLKSKFIEMFGNPINNPMGWEFVKLGDYTDLVSSGSTPKGGQSVYLEEGEIKFIRSQNVRMNKMDYNGIYYISEEIFDKMKRTQVKYNDVLINITGASIGRTAIYKDTSRANVNQHVCIIRLKDTMNSSFINYFIGSDSFQNKILSNQSGATREALNFTQIKNFKIFNIPIELQNKFASIVEKIETIKEKENQKLKQLEDLHNSLMQKAFKGEIE